MGEDSQKEWKPIETDEIREIRLREVLGGMLPVFLGYLLDRFKKTFMAVPGEEDTEEDLLESTDFLQEIPARDLEDKILREWKSGDDLLITSFLTLLILRGHLGLQEITKRLEGVDKTVIKPPESGDDFWEKIFDEHRDFLGVLSRLLDESKVFGKKYGLEDLKSWIERRTDETQRTLSATKKSSMRSELGSGRISQRQMERYKVLDRITSRGFRKEDREALREIIDHDIESELSLAEIDFVYSLRGKPDARGNLKNAVLSLLELHHIRNFVDQATPLKK